MPSSIVALTRVRLPPRRRNETLVIVPDTTASSPTTSEAILDALLPRYAESRIYAALLNGASLIPVETAELATPVAWIKATYSASLAIFRVSEFRRSMIVRGVPAGVNSPVHALTSKSGRPDSARVGRSGANDDRSFVVTPIAGGVRVGGAVEFAGLAVAPNYARADAMLAKARRFLPGLRTEGGTQWMGCRPSLPDSLPVIGPSPADGRLFYAFGHGHLGLTQAAATAQLAAAWATNRNLPPAAFAPQRFL